jgi:flagellar hook assembly protein FlgD
VVLEVFDLRGRLVRSVFRGELKRGPQSIPWDGKDDRGHGLASGTYLARLERADGSATTAKVALLR